MALTSRPYDNLDDLRQMQALLMAARAQSDDWRCWHVGDLNWWFFMVDCHLEPRQHIRLWHDGTGRLVAFALLGEDPAFEIQLLPEYEWQGIEADALAWAEERLAVLRQGDRPRWGGPIFANARQDNGRRVRFLEDHGFRRATYAEVNMLRFLDKPIPEPALPAGCQLRAVAETGELANRAGAQREVWQPYTVGNVSDEDYARFMRLPGYDRELDVVAVAPDGVIAAYVNGWLDPVNRIGDFGPLGARPAYRRQGLTRAALLESLRRMRARGMDRVSVSTGESNWPALGLYESAGFRIVNKYLEYRQTGTGPL